MPVLPVLPVFAVLVLALVSVLRAGGLIAAYSWAGVAGGLGLFEVFDVFEGCRLGIYGDCCILGASWL